MKGRVVVLKEYMKPYVIEEYDVPDPEPGAIVLKITQAGICGSDLHSWRGDQSPDLRPMPPAGRAAGHEGTGTVYKLGPGVSLLGSVYYVDAEAENATAGEFDNDGWAVVGGMKVSF